MIIQENIIINNKEYTKTYSDSYAIERDGVEYDEAIDPVDSGRVYIETENLKAGVDEENQDDQQQQQGSVQA